MAEPTLSVRSLSVIIPTRHADQLPVDDVSFDITPGKYWVFLVNPMLASPRQVMQ